MMEIMIVLLIKMSVIKRGLYLDTQSASLSPFHLHVVLLMYSHYPDWGWIFARHSGDLLLLATRYN